MLCQTQTFEEKRINMKEKYRNFILIIKILVACPFISSCQTKGITYEIKENFRGPCIVFIYNHDSLYFRNKIEIDKTGFARENKKEMYGGISFKIRGTSSDLILIDMPYLDSTKNDFFAIYGFFHANIDSKCNIKSGLEFIEFFVGTKAEYIAWRDKNESILEYFDKKGIDWCKYYKAN